MGVRGAEGGGGDRQESEWGQLLVAAGGSLGSPGPLGGREVLQNDVCSSWHQELRKARALAVSLQMEWFLCDES